MHDFDRWLRAHFGSTPPTGDCLRRDHPERWLRLRSLPGSKRYPEDEEERAEVRRRAWAAAAEVLPPGEPIWVVTGRFDDSASPLRVVGAPSLLFERAGRYEHSVYETPYVAFAARTTWPHEGADALVDGIAQEALRVAWFSASSGEAFAPYDGGIDLVLRSPQRVEALRRVFPNDWFSSRPDGL